MTAPQQPGHVTLDSLPDEELVQLYQLLHWPQMAVVVLGRCFKLIVRLARRQARRWHLQPNDVDDAQQEGILAFYKALDDYQSKRVDKPGPTRFRPFMSRVVHDDVLDYVRGVKRHLNHVECSTQADSVLEFALYRVRMVIACPEALEAAPTGPVTFAEEKELHVQLEQLIDHLEPLIRRVWDYRLAGLTFKGIASAMHISERTVRRYWHRLEAEVKRRCDECI